MCPEEPTFRKYVPSDLGRCAALAEQAWPIRFGSVSEREDSHPFEPWIESTNLSSTWAEVALVDGEVVGFLFGSIDSMKPKGATLKQLTDQLWMFRRMLSGGFGRFNIPLRLAMAFFFTEFRLEVNRPDADADITLLVVDTRFRGKDIGKRLVDSFVKVAEEAGAHAVLVYTDDKTSNWKFYEIYGFRKVNTFPDSISTYFAGERANAIYYLLNLKTK
jgi:ribosomal protein S18 acetylase RimI-like enzyme